jgi:N-acetylmuramoyl-L-alanine amidase
MKICIDAGHGLSNRREGIYDPGAIVDTIQDGQNVIIKEANLTLLYAISLAASFEKMGIYPSMTRHHLLESTPLYARTLRAKNAGADLLLSLHFNSSTNKKAHGLEIFYNKPGRDLASKLQNDLIATTDFLDRGIKQNPGFAVLNYERMAVLIEIGFISNANDIAAITDDDFQFQFCKSLARSLKEYGL